MIGSSPIVFHTGRIVLIFFIGLFYLIYDLHLIDSVHVLTHMHCRHIVP